MDFEVIGDLIDVETFAVAASIGESPRLRRAYGAGRWRIAQRRCPGSSPRRLDLPGGGPLV
jgi:hypothetical protein